MRYCKRCLILLIVCVICSAVKGGAQSNIWIDATEFKEQKQKLLISLNDLLTHFDGELLQYKNDLWSFNKSDANKRSLLKILRIPDLYIF